MIQKAVEKGVPPDRIAAALNLPVRVVKAYLNLLVGIHNEVAEMLKDKQIVPGTIRKLRGVSGVRQVEIAELMVAANNYAASYVDALILGTPKDQLVAGPVKYRKAKGVPLEQAACLKQEMETLEREIKAVEAGYGQSVLNLTLLLSYLRKLLENGEVAAYLTAHHGGIAAEFKRLAALKRCSHYRAAALVAGR
jgi:hypothetical protein